MALGTGELPCGGAEHPRIAEDLLDLVHLYSSLLVPLIAGLCPAIGFPIGRIFCQAVTSHVLGNRCSVGALARRNFFLMRSLNLSLLHFAFISQGTITLSVIFFSHPFETGR